MSISATFLLLLEVLYNTVQATSSREMDVLFIYFFKICSEQYLVGAKLKAFLHCCTFPYLEQVWNISRGVSHPLYCLQKRMNTCIFGGNRLPCALPLRNTSQSNACFPPSRPALLYLEIGQIFLWMTQISGRSGLRRLNWTSMP